MKTDSELLNRKDLTIMQLLRAASFIKEVSGWLKALTLRSSDPDFTERVNRIRKALEDVVMSLREEISIQERIIKSDIAPLDNLPEDVQSVMRLSLVYGCSLSDIADTLNITQEKVHELHRTGINMLFNVPEDAFEVQGIPEAEDESL